MGSRRPGDVHLLAEEAVPLGKEDIIDTLKDGVQLAGRMAARGMGEMSKALKPSKEGRGNEGDTGLYSQRHLHPSFGSLTPSIEFQEFQQPRRFLVNMLKNLAIPAAERSFLTGCQALLRGQWDEAKERMVDAFTKDAQFADAYFLHGGISLESGDPAAAVQSFKKVLLCQARLAAKIKKYVPSVRLTICLTENSSFAIYPDLLGVSLLLSIAYRANSNHEEAAQVLDQLLGVMPENPLVGFFLGLHHVEAGRWSDVVSLLKDTLPEDNVSLANLILLGKACVATDQGDTAVEIFRKILARSEFDPQLLVDVRYNLGASLAIQGFPAEAEQEFARVTSRYPGYLDLLERLGVTPMGRKSRALPERGGIPVVTDATPPPRARQLAAESAPAAPTTATDSARPSRELTPPAAPAPVAATSSSGLSLVSSDGRVTRALSSAPLVIGREEGDVVLDWDGAASRVHARVVPEEDGYWVEDMGSTNGTFVNGHRIGGKVLLNRGDVVTVGQTRFRLE